MALRLKPETREAWKKYLDQHGLYATATIEQWRPVPRAEPAPDPEPSSNTFDIYCKTWVDT